MTAAVLDAPAPDPIGRWIGPRPSGIELAALLFAGTVGILFAGVGPLLLGALHQAGRISAAQIGQAGTAELLTMGVAAGLTGVVAGLARLRLLVIVSGLAIAALDALTTRVDGGTLVAVRAATGIPSGALVWLMTAAIVRADRPERWSAIYLTLQTLAQLLIVAALGAWVIGTAGADAGFAVLAASGVAAAIAGLAIPGRFAALPVAAGEPTGLPSARGLVALSVAFLFNAAILAVWIYVDPLSREAGHPAGTADAALSLSLAAQVAGGALATVIAGRVAWAAMLIGSLLVMLALMAVFAALPPAGVFLAASALFGFLWMFASPFMTPLVIEADPTRRAAVFGSGAALLGASSGPFIASLVVSDEAVRGCAVLGGVLMLGAVAIVGALHLTRRRAA